MVGRGGGEGDKGVGRGTMGAGGKPGGNKMSGVGTCKRRLEVGGEGAD